MIHAYLYDAEGKDREIDLGSSPLPPLESHHLLWLDVVGRDRKDLDRLANLLRIDNKALVELATPSNGHALEDFDDHFRFSAIALAPEIPKRDPYELSIPKKVRLDCIVGHNWLVTIADEELDFLRAFRAQDRGETLIGSLSAAALAAALLDWHLTRYLEALERLERHPDPLALRAGRERAPTLPVLGRHRERVGPAVLQAGVHVGRVRAGELARGQRVVAGVVGDDPVAGYGIPVEVVGRVPAHGRTRVARCRAHGTRRRGRPGLRGRRERRRRERQRERQRERGERDRSDPPRVPHPACPHAVRHPRCVTVGPPPVSEQWIGRPRGRQSGGRAQSVERPPSTART